MLYLLNSGVSFQSVPSVAIVGPELHYSWLLEVREIRFLHTIWIPLWSQAGFQNCPSMQALLAGDFEPAGDLQGICRGF